MSTTLSAQDDHLMFPTVLQVIAAHLHWVRANFSQNTAEDAERFLRWAHAALPFGLPGAREEWEAFFTRPDWSPQTRATYLRHARRFFRWATDPDDRWLDMDPVAKLRTPRVHQPLPHPATDDQARAAVTRAAMPYLLHCRLAAYAGLRCIEVARLRREDMNEKEIHIYGKGDKPAVQPMHPVIWEIAESMPPGPITTPPARSKRTGLPVKPDDWVSSATRYHLNKVGAPVTMHQLRAWYITMIQRTYRDAAVTRRLARHARWDTTQVYVEIADESAREAVAGLPDLTGP